MAENESAKWIKMLCWQLPLLAGLAFSFGMASENLNEQVDRFIPETMTNCSTYNKKASGYRAFFELAQKVGLNCGRFEKSYRELEALDKPAAGSDADSAEGSRGLKSSLNTNNSKNSKGSKGSVLLIIAPQFLIQSHEYDQILSWVKKGNSLVYMDYFGLGASSYLLNKLNLRARADSSLEDKALDVVKSELMSNVEKIVVTTDSRISGTKNIILSSEKDKVLNQGIIVELALGKGRCLICCAPSLCANRRIAEESNKGNFQFLINWLKSCQAKVLFDEKVHGHLQSQIYYFYLARGPAGAIVVQLFAIFLVALVSCNQRFGRAKQLENKRKISASEHIEGMARTLKKARAQPVAFAIIYGSIMHKILRALSIPPSGKNEELAKAWSQAANLSYDELLAFLQKAESSQGRSTMSDEEMLALVKEMDRLFDKSKTYLPLSGTRRLGS